MSLFLAILLLLTTTFPVRAANIAVNTTSDELNSDGDCSLREAVQSANSDSATDGCMAGSGSDTLSLPAGTYVLALLGIGEDANVTGDLDISSNVSLSGPSAITTIVNGAAIDRIFDIHPGAGVQMDSLTIRNGKPLASAGGIRNRGTLLLKDSIISGNTGLDFGGGIGNSGTLTITDTTLENNSTSGANLSGGGGGIFTQGTATITRTTLFNNQSHGRGGAIYNLDLALTLANTTISGNTSLNGGGIFNRFGAVSLTHSTIANNAATDNGGGLWNFGGTMSTLASILDANNASTAADNCAGAITSLGYNLSSDASCSLASTGDQNSTNPLLGPLANNGGPTQTHALQTGSAAIDKIPSLLCPLSADQRGVSRPQGLGCDSGSYEHPPTLPPQCPGKIQDYNLIQGTSGNDNLNGTSARDLIFAYAGNDKVSGGSNADCLVGDLGNDKLVGGSGDDVLIGGDGKDRLDGDSGHDSLYGQNDDDDLRGGSGSDLITGDAGVDEAKGGTGTDTCTAEFETSCEL